MDTSLCSGRFDEAYLSMTFAKVTLVQTLTWLLAAETLSSCNSSASFKDNLSENASKSSCFCNASKVKFLPPGKNFVLYLTDKDKNYNSFLLCILKVI